MDESFYPHPSQRFRLNQQIGQLSRVGKFSEAVSKALKLLELREKVLGPEHLNTAGSLKWPGVLYQAMGDDAKAEPFSTERSKSTRRCWGPNTQIPEQASTIWGSFIKQSATTPRPNRFSEIRIGDPGRPIIETRTYTPRLGQNPSTIGHL